MLAWLSAQWRARRERKAKETALDRYGWDGTCPHCGASLHATKGTKLIGSTLWHWHYQCGKCDGLSHWNLMGMIPTLDQQSGSIAWANAEVNIARPA